MKPVPIRNLKGDSIPEVFERGIRSSGSVIDPRTGLFSCAGKLHLGVPGALMVVSGTWKWNPQRDLQQLPVELHARGMVVHADLRQARLVDWDGGALRVWMEVTP